MSTLPLNRSEDLLSSSTSASTLTSFSNNADHTYVTPTKSIKSMSDLALWEKSQAYHDILRFINGISLSIQGIPLDADNVIESETVKKLLEIFIKLNRLVDETPPIDQPQRFGNKAYRGWFNKLKENRIGYLKEILPEEYWKSIIEIEVYFTESFGNPTRIDYGTGHELNFIIFLCCLFKIGVLTEDDKVATGIKVFNVYLNFVRRLQLTYRMEPAGSHGVWSLDDYQFVPFIWGSAQLAINGPIEPKQFIDDEIVNKYKTKYMFIGCIDYIKQVKIGLFAEHSNQLWSITAVPSWTKINAGLVKMFQKELMGKFPVIQHVMLGSLMELKPNKFVMPPSRLGMLPPQIKPIILPNKE